MIDFSKVPSPCYVLDEQFLTQNPGSQIKKVVAIYVDWTTFNTARLSVTPESARP